MCGRGRRWRGPTRAPRPAQRRRRWRRRRRRSVRTRAERVCCEVPGAPAAPRRAAGAGAGAGAAGPSARLHRLDPGLARLRLLAIQDLHERLELVRVALARALRDVKGVPALVEREGRRRLRRGQRRGRVVARHGVRQAVPLPRMGFGGLFYADEGERGLAGRWVDQQMGRAGTREPNEHRIVMKRRFATYATNWFAICGA